MTNEKTLGADAAVVALAGSIERDAAPHAAPWRAAEVGGNSGDAEAVSIRDSNDFVVADVWIDCEYLVEGGRRNAHLIAAAPELLEALKLLHRASPASGWEQHNAHKAAADAIAKAEGRSK